MFDNDIYVNKTDKEIMLQKIKEINQILEKYPYFKEGTHCNTVTTISRAKSAGKQAEESIRLLYVEESNKTIERNTVTSNDCLNSFVGIYCD